MIAMLLACNHPLNYIRTAPTRRRERDSSDRASPNCDKPARCRDLDTIANSDGYNRLKPNRAFPYVLKIDMKCEERKKRLDIFLVAKNFPWHEKKLEEEDEEVEVAIADSLKGPGAPHQLLVSALFTSAASEH
ncbi:hypothetical protein ALC60_10579 [Trachymyrmex zeteki]|uniref:Uncharacterized protein n=1 Tax=Mycetomoellerius zeteki TaxID=64791 RepID=A0A151WQX6_9HYME|nr:hypothetical protein ALC60_10579 [Trachymyrmex zeteki]